MSHVKSCINGSYGIFIRGYIFIKKKNFTCNMHFNDVLVTFLSLDHVRILAVYGRVRELLECIKNILICVQKMNKGCTGLERHEGE